MNDLVAELREIHSGEKFPACSSIWSRAADEIERANNACASYEADRNRLALEVERLTAELKESRCAYADCSVNYDALRAERDRLKEEAKGDAAHIAALGYLTDLRVAEVKRLRALLEKHGILSDSQQTPDISDGKA